MQATPLVRRLAEELGVDLASVEATGPQGRVTEEDVRRAAGSEGEREEGRREPLRGVRRLVAERMSRAHREVPPVTWVEECDFGEVDLKRIVPTVLKAVAESLKDFPELNARLEGDEIVYLDRYDLGVAVQTDQGLVVPVVRGCGERTARRAGRRRRAPRGSRPRRLAEARGAPRLDLHGHERRQARRPADDADRQVPRGRDPQRRPHRRPPGRPRGRDHDPAGRDDRDHVRPPRGRRRPCGRVRAGRDSSPRSRVSRSPAARVHRAPSVEGSALRARAGRASRPADASRCARSRRSRRGFSGST